MADDYELEDLYSDIIEPLNDCVPLGDVEIFDIDVISNGCYEPLD